jgi:hypothetical protein
MKPSFNPDPYADQRSSPRRKALLPAKVVDRDSARSIDCTIRDISDGGAGIEFAADQIVPNQVFLIDMRSGNAHKAEVRWRKPRKAGLRFLQTISLREPVPEELQHLKRLWESASARPAPDAVKVTPDMTSAGVAALAAWRLDNIPALASEHDMVRTVFIAMYGTMAK